MTLLGGTNVQASAPEVRDVIERGVADAITFPWGSILLFGIDKVTKYHMDVPLYVTTFAFVMNKAKYDEMSAAQKKVIDDHCTTEWAAGASPIPGPSSRPPAATKMKALAGHEVYPLTPSSSREWKKAAEPLVQDLGRQRARRSAATRTIDAD